MAEIVVGLVGQAIQVVKWVGAPILRQFNYLCCFTANITNLKNEAQNLQVTEGHLQGKVDTARNDVRVISGEVETWLQNSKDIKDEMDGIINEVPNVEGGCFKLRARFSLSKRAMKTIDRSKELRDQCRFSDISISMLRPPPAMMAIPSKTTYEFQSRKQIEEDIMTTLRDGDVTMMGICGMGGLGKTTMAKRIMNRALEEHVLEEIVMVVVSQPVEELKIQLEIGGSLGLKLKGETSQARVQKLHARLSGPKRILLILDDVWQRFQPKDLGIPCDYKGCTILVTSRNRDVLREMNVQKIFGMELLSEEDSWFLFKEKVGTHADDIEFNCIAIEVMNECGRLPIALTTVGAALKDKVNVTAWKNALQQLKSHDPNIPDFIKKVYNPLELSYDVLEHKYQLVFLLCCLYPEDADIPLERLTYFCMGLRLFERGMAEERDRMHSLTNVLKDRSLLLDSNKGDDYVRMHAVVRDVCIFIARKNNYISGGDSSLQRYEFDPGYALLQIRNSTDKEIKFDGIRDLYVLSIEYCSLTSLPFTQRQINLITLVLDSCEGLETLSVVGELVNLKILICRYCYSVKELPPEIKGLNRLKVLDLSWCGNLKRIGRGIISCLVGLEELKMLGSFKKWEGEDREERENAGLKELGQLPNLRCLEIEIEDLALAAENIGLSSAVNEFAITFLCESRWLSNFDKYLFNKKMCLNWEGATCLGDDWIKMQLVRDTECLLLVGNGVNEVGPTNLEKITCLELGECESMKEVVTSSMDDGGATVFPSIEHLMLFKLPKLEEIHDDRILSNSFKNLKILKLDGLRVPKQLWKSSQNDLGKDFLPQLEVLGIRNCEMIEVVFLWKGEDSNENNSCHHITKIFPKLKELELVGLPNLISFCQGIKGIEFPLLRRMEINECGKMKGMVSNEGGLPNLEKIRCLELGECESMKKVVTSSMDDGGAIVFPSIEHLVLFKLPKLEEICDHRILLNSNFQNLKTLKLDDLPVLKQVWKSSQNDLGKDFLPQLEVLEIRNCEKMEVVFLWKGEDRNENNSCHLITKIFPKLKELELVGLPNLISFCQGIKGIEFPLSRMEINKCSKMKGMVSNENNSGGSSSNASIHDLFRPQEVSFDRLKKVDTDWNQFSEIEELTISECAGSLTSSSKN